MSLTAVEIVKHPAYQGVRWDLKPTEKGRCSVAKGRGGPFDLAYEIHGDGPVHIIVKHPRNGADGSQPAKKGWAVDHGPCHFQMVLATTDQGFWT